MKYIFDLKQYHSKSKRIQGFKKPLLLNLKTPKPIMVISHLAFVDYQKEKRLPKQLVTEITEVFREIRKKNPHRGAYIGRGFFIPGMENPPGPRTAGIYDGKEYLQEIENFFKFVIESKFDIKGADIALLLHPFIHPYLPPLSKKPEVAYPGGAITPSREDPHLAVIEAIWGHDEGIQTLPHDTYLTDFEKNIILEKRIHQKTEALKAQTGQKYQRVSIPPAYQHLQALNDLEILYLAQDYKKVVKRFGPHRLEFILQPEGIIYRECLPFSLRTEIDRQIDTIGEVLSISSAKDLERVTQNNKIIAIHPKVIQERNMGILTSLAVSAPHQSVILYPGTATTAHAATIFREKGHLLVYVRQEIFKSGQRVKIIFSDGQLKAKRLIKIPRLFFLDQPQGMNPQLVGNKAYHLMELNQNGFLVPPGFVVSTLVFEEMIKKQAILKEITDLKAKKTDINTRERAARKIKKKIMTSRIDQDFILKAFAELKVKKAAVRSSTNCEDSQKQSFAGQFSTYLNVSKDNLMEKVKECWAQTYSANVLIYALANKIDPIIIKNAVLIQQMVPAKKAGTIFTKNIINNDSSQMVIEAVYGLGESLVDGTADPERIIIDKKTKEIISQTKSKNQPILNKKETEGLIKLGLEVENLYHQPQDIEWAIANHQIYLLQARPITG